MRTLRKVIVTYPEVRHILPDRISLVADAAPEVLHTMSRFLQRQQWLLSEVVLE